MAQTPNLGLHQWEPGDPFLRTDFNGDFQKIDTAVGILAQQVAVDRLEALTLSHASNQIQLDLRGVSLSRYARLELSLAGTTLTDDTAPVRAQFNGLTGTKYSYMSLVGGAQTAVGDSVPLGSLSAKGCAGYLHAEFHLLQTRGVGFSTRASAHKIVSTDTYYSCTAEAYEGSYAGTELEPEALQSIRVYLLNNASFSVGTRLILLGIHQ